MTDCITISQHNTKRQATVTIPEILSHIYLMENEEAKKLLTLVADGDQRAFEKLYRAQSRAVYAYVLVQLRNAAEAEEVLSETMFDLWKSAAKFKGESTVRTWIFGIARNKMLMRFRELVKERNKAHDNIDDYAETLSSDEPDVVALIADTQRQHGVKKCMDKLSQDHRECLHLVHFEGCKVDEIAALLQVPIGTVKSRLNHARLNITACLVRLLRAEREFVVGDCP